MEHEHKFEYWADTSPDFNLDTYSPCTVTLTKHIEFSSKAALTYNLEKRKFISENWDRSQLFEFHEEIVVDGIN
jgi:hypothetical protein